MALIVAGVYLAVYLDAHSNAAASDSAVESDLANLLASHGIQQQGMSCVHQGRNQWACIVTMPDGSQQTAQVTDDGHTVYEQGIAANGTP